MKPGCLTVLTRHLKTAYYHHGVVRNVYICTSVQPNISRCLKFCLHIKFILIVEVVLDIFRMMAS